MSISEVAESDPRMVCTAKRADRVMVIFDGFCEIFGIVKWLWEMCAFIVSLPSSPKLPTAVAASISYFQRRKSSLWFTTPKRKVHFTRAVVHAPPIDRIQPAKVNIFAIR